jgi:hypothetical protein
MAILIDSYSESNYGTDYPLYYTYSNPWGQTFACGANLTLDSAKGYFKPDGSPGGNITAKIYSITGTHGTDGKPGTLLATSDVVAGSSIYSQRLVTFNFSGANRISLAAGTNYCIAFFESTGSFGGRAMLGGDNSSPTHGGNFFYSSNGGSTWTVYESVDACFYVYGELAATPGASFLLLMT